MKKNFLDGMLAVAGMVTLMAAMPAQSDEGPIDISKIGDPSKAIPVSMSGFTGEAKSVLETDLYVIGFEFVDSSKAKYFITGSNNGRLEGSVTDPAKSYVLQPKAYSGGSSRAQAHAFANDIAKAFNQVPIFNGRIAFRMGAGEKGEIYIADFDGGNAQPVTRDGTDVKSPTWVPGRRQLLYTSYKATTPAIYLQDLETGDRRPVAKYGGSSYSPAVSPDGRHFAFVSSMSGQMELYSSGIDGASLKALTKSKDYEASPCWSSDGSKICYSAPYKTRAALYTISPNGGEPHRLNVGGFLNLTEPAWSPDGKQIAFTSQMGTFRICVVSAQGGEAKEIIDGGEDPSWAPNSRTIIFTRRKGNGRVLSLLDVPTKHYKDIAQISGSCSQPSWAK